jgi:hypothetical protein
MSECLRNDCPKHIGAALVVIAVVLATGGCGRDTERLPLAGRVSWQGRPLEKGSIVFVPTDGHRGPKIGAKIVDGGYQIESQRGGTPGAYRVEVRSDTGDYPHSPTDARPSAAAVAPKQQLIIPPEYNTQSRLTAAVSAEQTTFNFELPNR